MTELLLSGFSILLLAAIFVLQVFLLRRKSTVDFLPLQLRFDQMEKGQERTERQLREEIAKNREESLLGSRQTREETAASIGAFGNSLQSRMAEIAGLQKNQLDSFARQLSALIQTNEQKFDLLRSSLEERLLGAQEEERRQLSQMRAETGSSAKQLRDDVSSALKNFNDSVLRSMAGMSALLKKEIEVFGDRIGKMSESNEGRLEAVRNTVETRLKNIQEENARQLDQMRATVDEKLQGTLEKRLGESFKQVSDRLEQVHKGLGEMQNLAAGVGDLKKVLTNVKTRGMWGEVQLGALLEQILSADQYERNVRPDENSSEVVEFAIKLPGRGDGDERPVWLPVDAKFPVEDYQRLVEAQENADLAGIDTAAKMLSSRIKSCAKDISEKYLRPPHTTDFGIMFLPAEGLYAEVARRVDLVEAIQRECRVVIAGPTTFAALLNSLQMGFQTLAIQKRSSEVWKLLGAVKTEFGKFGDVLDGIKRKLEEASNKMDGAARRSRAIERRLREVQELPQEDARMLLTAPRGEVERDEA